MKQTSLAFTLRDRALRGFLDGSCTRFRRPIDGQYREVVPGDRLWLREPFYLPFQCDGIAPTQAAILGLEPAFAVDLTEPLHPELGKKRPARTLLREWHRFHALVVAVDRQRLKSITEAEAKAEGMIDRQHWLEEYDASVASFGDPGGTRRSENNPWVLVLTLQLVRSPLDLPKRTSNNWKEIAA